MVGLRGFLVGVLVLVISVSLSDLGTSIGWNQASVKALEKPCQIKGLGTTNTTTDATQFIGLLMKAKAR